MTNPLKIAPPPARRITVVDEPTLEPPAPVTASSAPAAASKFRQVKEDERVQFNKRVTRRVADGFEILAIRAHKKVPELLAEALDLLEERYGRVV